MSALFVGQRVKIVRCYNPNLMRYLGTETIIVGRAPGGEWELPPHQNFPGWTITASSECLEPILPTGLESLDRINELYEPEPEVVRV